MCARASGSAGRGSWGGGEGVYDGGGASSMVATGISLALQEHVQVCFSICMVYSMIHVTAVMNATGISLALQEHVQACIYMYVCMYIIYIYRYMHTHTHTHTHTQTHTGRLGGGRGRRRRQRALSGRPARGDDGQQGRNRASSRPRRRRARPHAGPQALVRAAPIFMCVCMYITCVVGVYVYVLHMS